MAKPAPVAAIMLLRSIIMEQGVNTEEGGQRKRFIDPRRLGDVGSSRL